MPELDAQTNQAMDEYRVRIVRDSIKVLKHAG
jgi:hypothetical protein